MSYLTIVSFLTKVPFVLRDLEVADFCDLKLWLSCKPGFCWNLYAICLFCVLRSLSAKTIYFALGFLFCFVLGNNSYSFLGDVKTSCYCVKETIELTGKFTGLSLLHGTVFEFFLEYLSLTWTCFRFLFQFLLSFGFSCKNLEVNFDFFPSNH